MSNISNKSNIQGIQNQNQSPYIQRLSLLSQQKDKHFSYVPTAHRRPVVEKKYKDYMGQCNGLKQYYTQWEMYSKPPDSAIKQYLQNNPITQTHQPEPEPKTRQEKIKALQLQMQKLQASINQLSNINANTNTNTNTNTHAFSAFKEPTMDNGMWYGNKSIDRTSVNIENDNYELESYMEDTGPGGVPLDSAFQQHKK